MEDINNTANMPEENKQEIFIADGVRNNSFIKESNGKIGVLSFLFSIFYPIGYFYKQWKAIKKNNEEYKNISPFWRGLFYPFYAFQFTKILDNLLSIKKNMDFSGATNEEEKKKLENEYATFKQFYSNSYFIALIPIVTLVLIFCNFIPESFNTGIGIAIWISISMTLRNLQKAIDKISPQDHPKGKLTFSDFLGLPFLVLFLSFFFFEIGGQSCFEVDGNTLKNTCEKYSFTFPLTGEIKEIKPEYFYQFGPDEGLNIAPIALDKEEYFDLDFIASKEYFPIINKWTKVYQGNTTHCFLEEGRKNIKQSVCYMKLENDTPRYILFASQSYHGNIENLEKLMNSYKTW